MRKLLFERMAADFEDQVPQPPVKLRIPEARIAAENVGNVRGAKGAVDFTARIGSGGRVHAAGAMVTQPFAIDWKIDVGGVDLLPLRPYFEAQTNVIVTSGALTAKGRLTYGGTLAGRTGRGLRGDVTISDFGALDRPTAQELVRWKTLTLTGVDVADTPRKVALGAIALDQFYARLIVNPDATLNLQRLLSPGREGARRRHRRPRSTPAPRRRSSRAEENCRVDRRHQGEPRRGAVLGLLHQAELFGASDRRLRQRVGAVRHAGRQRRGRRARRRTSRRSRYAEP